MGHRDEREGRPRTRGILRQGRPVGASTSISKPVATPATVSGHAGQGLCAYCWGSRAIFQSGPLGLVPVVCRRCSGTGREPQPRG